MTSSSRGFGISRRGFLIGGGVGVGLLVAWAAWPRSYSPNLVASEGEEIFNAFLKIGEDGHVTVVVPQAEMGQGVWTSLPQALADELGADWRTVGVEPAPLNPLYANDLWVAENGAAVLPEALSGAGDWAAREFAIRNAVMITAGSTSIRGFETRFREAG
ncbi:MAG: molybdopterin-dependent oxidoreductase, partial [Sphingomonadaceae bacterium]|nr:molybdopterin-dependent oxidoreductase [Sphingomonadaceae bacterium]